MTNKSHSYDGLARQVDRLQAELDRLRSIATSFDPRRPPEKISSVWIRAILKARRRRDIVFGSKIFSDPAWDILLELYAVELENGESTITDASKASGIASTTGLRWVGELQRLGLVTRNAHETDRRMAMLKLSPKGLAAMKEYFHEGLSGGAPL